MFPFLFFLLLDLILENIDFALFFNIVVILAGDYHRVKLRYHDGALSYGPKFPSDELVNKMAELVVVFFFLLGFVDRKLKFALYLPHEEIVDDDIVSRIIKFILDSDQLELPLQLFPCVKHVHSFKEVDEGVLAALKLRSHQVTNSEPY